MCNTNCFCMHRRYFLLTTCLIAVFVQAQQIRMLASGKNISLRGLSVVDERVIWVSGSSGTIGRSLDSGNTWHWQQIKGFEKTDFRDIEAFDGATALVMGVGSPAYILKTNNGGDDWKVVFEDHRPGMFLDAMEFWNEQSGIVVGDPIDHKIFIARTFDEGTNWQMLPDSLYPKAMEGEAMFAASGTNVRALSLSEAAFVTGGVTSRIFIRNHSFPLPLVSGKETTGANSFAVFNDHKRRAAAKLIVVGGDFSADTLSSKNCVLSLDGGKTWQAPQQPPYGYKSCVEFIDKKKVVTCGTSGVDLSSDGGMNWYRLSKDAFHVCRRAKKGHTIFFAGANGRIGKLSW